MHPFFSNTRASMISWPTTNWRCNNGLRSSSGIEVQGMYCSSSFLGMRLVAARLALARDFVFERDVDLDLGFVLAMRFVRLMRFSAVPPGLRSTPPSLPRTYVLG